MRILAISHKLPDPRESSGDLRFHSILQLLAESHTVTLALSDQSNATQNGGSAALVRQYAVTSLAPTQAIGQSSPDIVLFEFYHVARKHLKAVRLHAPRAVIATDSVDVHFNRLESKARLSMDPRDCEEAASVKFEELEAYTQSDVVIAVSDEDAGILRTHLPGARIATLPNVHVIYPDQPRIGRRYGELIFVGGFRHEPNVDSIRHFVADIFPMIRTSSPDARLSIIGSHAPPEVHALACQDIAVLGFVPDTAPFLSSAYISIAPLRYGGGMKGKVGEAMAHGLPVVTTSIGAEGLGVEPGRHLLVANSDQEFANSVVRLLRDDELHDRLSRNSRQFIEERFSTQAMRATLTDFVAQSQGVRIKSLPLAQRLRHKSGLLYDRHIRWRLNA